MPRFIRAYLGKDVEWVGLQEPVIRYIACQRGSGNFMARNIATATIPLRSKSPKIAFARTDAYQRDHMMRVAGQPDETPGLNSVVVMNTTTFSDEDAQLRVVDEQSRDRGPARPCCKCSGFHVDNIDFRSR